MNKKQVIERLCAICTNVGSEVFKNIIPHDCFCNKSVNDDNFQFDRKIVDFIEDAVENAIKENIENIIVNEIIDEIREEYK